MQCSSSRAPIPKRHNIWTPKQALPMKNRYKYFVYISLFFLAVALYYADYLKMPVIISLSSVLVSLLFLFLGFVSSAFAWKKILQKSNYHVAFIECIAGTGLSIFGKYMPGKIWVIVGRASYIAEKHGNPLSKLTTISLNAQFIDIWTGLILGTAGIFLLGGPHLWTWLILILFLILTALIFSNLVQRGVQKISHLFKKGITIPDLTIGSIFSILPWFATTWILWSIGFYIFVRSITSIDVSLITGLGFPLAGTLGTLAFITPGGLGAREAIMVGYLALAEIPAIDATAIAVASRLWFFAGEVFIFTLGLAAYKMPIKTIDELGS